MWSVRIFLTFIWEKQISGSFIDMFLLERVSSTSEIFLKTLQTFVVKLIEIY